MSEMVSKYQDYTKAEDFPKEQPKDFSLFKTKMIKYKGK